MFLLGVHFKNNALQFSKRKLTRNNHVSITYGLYLVNIVHLYPLIEARVQTVQHVDHLVKKKE